jgi:hypothetical protein
MFSRPAFRLRQRENPYLNLYVFDNTRNPLQHGAEVIIEKFEFLP